MTSTSHFPTGLDILTLVQNATSSPQKIALRLYPTSRRLVQNQKRLFLQPIKLFLLLKAKLLRQRETGSHHSNLQRGDYECKSRNKRWCCYLLFSPPHLHFCSQVLHIFPIHLLGIFLSPGTLSSTLMADFGHFRLSLLSPRVLPNPPPCPRPSRSGTR